VGSKEGKIVLREFFISDIHIPFHDPKAVEVFFELLKEERKKVNMVWIGGDLIDFYAVSSWVIDITEADFLGELRAVERFFQKLRKVFQGKVVWQEGNHEERLIKYILKRASALAPLFKYDLSIEKLLNLKSYQIEYKRGVQRVGKLYHLHGHEKRVAGQVVHIALNMLRWLQRSFVCGHFHRFNSYVLKEMDKAWKMGFVNGCMFDVKRMPTPYEYIDLSQKGFLVIEYDDAGWFNIKPVFFIEENGGYKFYWDGEFRKI